MTDHDELGITVEELSGVPREKIAAYYTRKSGNLLIFTTQWEHHIRPYAALGNPQHIVLVPFKGMVNFLHTTPPVRVINDRGLHRNSARDAGFYSINDLKKIPDIRYWPTL